jgi:hypothetical protein
MATDSTDQAPDPATANGLPNIHMMPSAWEGLKIYEQEIETYLRELPRLINEGYLGKTALVRGEEVHSIWDTRADAVQAGRILFGLDPIFVKTIEHRDIKNYTLLRDYYRAHTCPSS